MGRPTDRPALRLLTTNDFFCSLDPQRTSYGRLPGGHGLANAIARLRDGATASAWFDIGDFAQGGPLSRLTSGNGGFEAAAELGIDAAVAGNHEFDWGRDHLVARARELPFPLLAANDDIDLPGTLLVDAGAITVGLVGLTQFDAPRPGPFWTISDWDQDLRNATTLGYELAKQLRADGADVVIAGIHAGAHLVYEGGRTPRADLAEMTSLCRAWAEVVDCVLAAHTLARHIGWLEGVPFLQPWAYGAEIGVLDLWPDGRRTIAAHRPGAGSPWRGASAAELEPVRRAHVGTLDAPLVQRPGSDVGLGWEIAAAMAARAGAGSALVLPWELCTQPPIDGAFAHLPAGPVHEAEVLRLAPYVGPHVPDRALVADLTPAQIDEVVAQMPPAFGAPPMLRGNAPGLAVTSHATEIVDHWLGESVPWDDAGFGVADALRDALSERGARPRGGR